MAIRYFVRFTEGHARKRDALKYIEEVNKAVGAQIAYYHGAVAV